MAFPRCGPSKDKTVVYHKTKRRLRGRNGRHSRTVVGLRSDGGLYGLFDFGFVDLDFHFVGRRTLMEIYSSLVF